MATTTLTLKVDDLLLLLNGMESVFTDLMTKEELALHDKLYTRLTQALERIA